MHSDATAPVTGSDRTVKEQVAGLRAWLGLPPMPPRETPTGKQTSLPPPQLASPDSEPFAAGSTVGAATANGSGDGTRNGSVAGSGSGINSGSGTASSKKRARGGTAAAAAGVKIARKSPAAAAVAAVSLSSALPASEAVAGSAEEHSEAWARAFDEDQLLSL